MKRVRVVAALILEASDRRLEATASPTVVQPGERRFLVQQRLQGKSRANLWEFPGGKVEPEETDQAALRRECREELEVELLVGPHLWRTVHEYPDLEIALELYAATIVSGTPRAVGAQAICWCTVAQLQALPFCEADVPLIAELARGL